MSVEYGTETKFVKYSDRAGIGAIALLKPYVNNVSGSTADDTKFVHVANSFAYKIALCTNP
jgi:hypothetical protein